MVSGIGVFMAFLALWLHEPARTDDRGNQLELETKIAENEIRRHFSEPEYRFTSMRQSNNAVMDQIRIQSVMSLQHLNEFDNELGQVKS